MLQNIFVILALVFFTFSDVVWDDCFLVTHYRSCACMRLRRGGSAKLDAFAKFVQAAGSLTC